MAVSRNKKAAALGNSPSCVPVVPLTILDVIAPIVAPAVLYYLIPEEFMETFSTTRINEQADWGARVEDCCGTLSVLAPKTTKSPVLRLVGEDQPSQSSLGKWVVVSLCAILSSALVYFIFLRT